MVQLPLFMYCIGSLGIVAILFACSTPHETDLVQREPAIVEIDTQVHFLTPSGENVVVLPGAYEVKAEKFGLRLISKEGTGDETMLIEANAMDHQESVTNPMAFMLSDKRDSQVLTLFLPNGKSWEAWGTWSGVHTRTAQSPGVSITEIKRNLNSRNQAELLIPQLSLSTVSVKYEGSKKSYKGEKSKTTWRLPVNDTLNSGIFTFTWGGYWEKSALKPSFIPRKDKDFQNLVNKKQCCIKLTINGKEARISRLKFGTRGTLLTRTQLTNVQAKTWPKTVKVVVTKGKKTWESAATKIYANTMSYYESELHPIFSHDRCTTCHALGTHDRIVEMHQYRLGIEKFPYQFDEEARPHNPTFCGTCHNAPNLRNKWFAPDKVQGINWRGWDPNRVCQKVTGPLTNKDGEVEALFDPDRFDHHLHDDPKILWAVSDGLTPSGKDLDVPLPDDLNAWFSKVDPWMDAGTPCPNKDKFFLRDRSESPEKFFPRQ